MAFNNRFRKSSTPSANTKEEILISKTVKPASFRRDEHGNIGPEFSSEGRTVETRRKFSPTLSSTLTPPQLPPRVPRHALDEEIGASIRLPKVQSNIEKLSTTNPYDDYKYENNESAEFEGYQTIAIARPDVQEYPEYFYDQKRYIYNEPRLEIDLLLIGKTGQGKSALGNSILGRNAFESKHSFTSITKAVTDKLVEYKGYVIKVVDGPGVADTELENEEAKLIKSLSCAISINLRGYHAFLLVIKCNQRESPERVTRESHQRESPERVTRESHQRESPERVTRESHQRESPERVTRESRLTIEVLRNVFGEDFIKKFCVVVFTHGDQFEYQEKKLSVMA